MDNQQISASKVISELQRYEHAILEQSEWYQQIFTHQKVEYHGKPLPTLLSIGKLNAFLESGLMAYTAKVDIPIVGGGTHSIPGLEKKVYNAKVANNFVQFCLTEGTGACLCVMQDGSIKLVPNYLTAGNSDLVCVLQYSSTLTDFSNKGLGQFANCINLVYVPPIPEGVKDLSNAFYHCISLNCPIHIPSTVTNVKGMLDGCTNFNNKIIGESFLKCQGHENYLTFYSCPY